MTIILKILRFAFYAIIVLIGVVFCVSNRASTDLTFYPLPYILSMPLFLFAILIFFIGLLLGWMMAKKGFRPIKRTQKEMAKRNAALENEISTLRTERLSTTKTLALPQQ